MATLPGVMSPDFGTTEAPPEQSDPVEVFKEGLKRIIQFDVRGDTDIEKTYQLSDIRKFEYYWRGFHFLRRTVAGDGAVDWAPLQPNANTNRDGAPEDLYSYHTNDIRGYGRKFIGVLAQQPPNVKLQPNKKTDGDHIRRARKAQSVADILRGLWSIKEITRQAAFGFWKSGTQFIYTPFVADADKYGASEEQVMEDQQIPVGPAQLNCVNCGAKTPIPENDMPPRACPGPMCGQEFGPEDYIEPETVAFPIPTGETKKYPNGSVEAHLYNGMYVTTPFSIRDLSDTPWLDLTYEEFKGKILAAYSGRKEIYKKLREMFESEASGSDFGGAAQVMAQTTRDLAQSPIGTTILPHKNRWMFSRIWMRPAMYEMAKGEVELDGENMLLRDALAQKFPSGLKITMVQDTIIDLEEEILDYVWTMAQPETAENAYPDPICKDMISSQDLTNHCDNIMAETLERQIPMQGIDVDIISLAAKKQYQLPASVIPMRRKGGASLKDAVVNLAVAKAEPEMVSYPVGVREHAAEGVGITPAIYGGGQREATAYATNLKRNQAMLQLGPALDALRDLIAGAMYNGVMQMAKHSGGRIPSPYAPKSEFEVIDGLEELTEGGWHAEAEDSLPQAWSEKRAALLELMEKNPNALMQLGFGEIDNIPLVQDLLVGIPEWKVPNSDDLHKVNNCIRKLLSEQPIQQPGMNGMLTLPSVPVDEFTDNHSFCADAIRRWAQTEDAQQEREKNPTGYSNVIAWGTAHAGLALPPPAPMGGPGGPPPGPGGPPPPPGGPQNNAPDGAPQRLMPPSGGDQPGAPVQ